MSHDFFYHGPSARFLPFHFENLHLEFQLWNSNTLAKCSPCPSWRCWRSRWTRWSSSTPSTPSWTMLSCIPSQPHPQLEVWQSQEAESTIFWRICFGSWQAASPFVNLVPGRSAWSSFRQMCQWHSVTETADKIMQDMAHKDSCARNHNELLTTKGICVSVLALLVGSKIVN